VIAVRELGESSGTALPVDVDARFALTLRIVKEAPLIPEWKPGSEVTFAIHSPTLAFAGDPKIGKTYNFALCREVVNDKVRFSGLGVKLKRGSIDRCE
jgi:hypothetical protein